LSYSPSRPTNIYLQAHPLLMQLRHIALLASLLALVLATVPVMAEDGDAAEEGVGSEADRPSLIELTFYSKDRILLVYGLSEDSDGSYIISPYSVSRPPSSTGWQCSNGDFFTHEELYKHDFIEEVEQGYTELRFDAVFETAPPAGGDGEGIELSLEGILTPVLIAFGAVLIGCAAVYLLARRVH